MQLETRLSPRKTALFLGFIALYLAVQSLLSEYLLEKMIGADVDSIVVSFIDLLSVNAEATIPTWYSTLLLFVSAAILAYIASIKRRNHEPFAVYWVGLSAVFLYLSMDEGAVIHEIVSDYLQATFNTTGYLAFAWLILFVPLVIIFALLYLRFLWHLPPATRALFILAGFLYVGGAVVVEAISANRWSLDGGVTFPYLAIATVEEFLEMLGVVVFIYALLAYMVASGYTAVFQFTLPHEEGSVIKTAVRWKRPLKWVILLILVGNMAMILWAIRQQDTQAVNALTTTAFYQQIADRYAGQGVIILQVNETLSLENPAASPIANSLLTLFNDVLVVSLPQEQISIAFVSQDLPFDKNSLFEFVSQSDITDFNILDVSDLRTLAK